MMLLELLAMSGLSTTVEDQLLALRLQAGCLRSPHCADDCLLSGFPCVLLVRTPLSVMTVVWQRGYLNVNDKFRYRLMTFG